MSGDGAVINGKKRFLAGMNIAWITSNTFGNDVGDTKINIAGFTDKVKKIRKSGGNTLRWRLHTDASHCPKIDAYSYRRVPGPKLEHINDRPVERSAAQDH